MRTICECCGQPDGMCPTCGLMHSPAIPNGCESCATVEPSQVVICENCGYQNVQSVDFLNIQEDIQGRDLMTFVCNECQQEQRSYVLG